MKASNQFEIAERAEELALEMNRGFFALSPEMQHKVWQRAEEEIKFAKENQSALK
jgi:hypothetical protein